MKSEAFKSLGVTQDYFYLHWEDREISPETRYLELESMQTLRPEMAVTLQNGEINGLYEAYAGFHEAALRNDVDMTLFFSLRMRKLGNFNLINPETYVNYEPFSRYRTASLRSIFGELPLLVSPQDIQVERYTLSPQREELNLDKFSPIDKARALSYLVTLGNERALQEFLSWQNSDYLKEKLCLSTLMSGREDFFSRVKSLLPSSNVPPSYLQASVYGGNPSLYEKVVELSGEKSIPPSLIKYLQRGTYIKQTPYAKDVEGIYRFALLPVKGPCTNVDICLSYYLEKESPEIAKENILANLGNLDILSIFLPVLDKEEINIDEKKYPLSYQLIST